MSCDEVRHQHALRASLDHSGAEQLMVLWMAKSSFCDTGGFSTTIEPAASYCPLAALTQLGTDLYTTITFPDLNSSRVLRASEHHLDRPLWVSMPTKKNIIAKKLYDHNPFS